MVEPVVDGPAPLDEEPDDEEPDDEEHQADTREVIHTAAPKPNPWTAEEEQLRTQIEGGETIVVSLRGQHDRLIAWATTEDRYVRVDRRSNWGNAFLMPDDGDRDTVIANYEHHYLPHKPSLLNRLDELRGKALGCWCAPEPCHADVLARAQGGLFP